MSDLDDLLRIERGLLAAARLLGDLTPADLAVERKPDGDPVTGADRAVDDLLRSLLPREGEGWLSEESEDDPGPRLACRRVWVVDPLDGTRQFVAGMPEWCVSIALVEDGDAVAGGTMNPATGEIFLGDRARGLLLNGGRVAVSPRARLEGATVLASRSEVGRGEWDRFRDAPFTVLAVGSVAYKMSLVAAGRADATWSRVPKHEWDVAAGVALLRAAGGAVLALDGSTVAFNRPHPVVPGLVGANPTLAALLRGYLA